MVKVGDLEMQGEATTSGITGMGTFTRDMTSASGDVAYTGIGFRPSLVMFSGGRTLDQAATMFGVTKGTGATDNAALYLHDGNIAYFNTVVSVYCIHFDTSASDHQWAALSSFDSDGFTLTWTKGGSPTGSATGMFVAFK